MLSPTQAIQKALGTSRNDPGMCDKWVASYYGYGSSGYATAIAHWNSIPPDKKHPGDNNPPAGALVFWSGGSTGAGHVALSLGGGKIVSTDYPRSGITSTTTIDAISSGWGEHYQGWATPVFQGQVSQASFPSGTASAGNILGGLASGSVLDLFTSGFKTDIKDIAERGALIILGGILIIVGIVSFNAHKAKLLIKEKAGEVKESRKAAKDAANDAGTEAEKEVGNGVRERQGGESVLRNGE